MSKVDDAVAMARRLAAGRTPEMLLTLMDTRLFGTDGPSVAPGDACPRRGLCAKVCGEDCIILDTFARKGRHRADVAALQRRPRDQRGFVLGKAKTVDSNKLEDIGPRYDAVFITENKRRKVVYMPVESPTSGGTEDAAGAVARVRASSSRLLRNGGSGCGESRWKPGVVVVQPQSAAAHAAEACHSVYARTDTKAGGTFVLDFPMPHEIDVRSWRCSSCSGQGENTSFKVMLSDVQVHFPGTIAYHEQKRGTVYMTHAFLVHLLSIMYETLNSRDARRRLADVYAANALGLVRRHDRESLSPYSLAWQLQAIPDSAVLRLVMSRGLRHFVKARVQVMKRRQFVYNAQGLRCDGNFKLAIRVVVPKFDKSGKRSRWWSRPYTVVLAFCGTDGSLLQPVTLHKAESWADIQSVLVPLLMEIKRARLEFNLSMEDSMPAFHATDSYGKHRLLAAKCYERCWEELRVKSVAPTPKVDCVSAVVAPAAEADVGRRCLITGEPFHKVISLRKLISPSSPDARDVILDYTDCINRLSAELPIVEDFGGADGQEAWTAQELSDIEAALKVAVQELAENFQKYIKSNPGKATVLRKFMKHPMVRSSLVWKRVFGNTPPRGTLARIARRLGCSLDERLGFVNYASVQDFKRECGRVMRWYSKCRKLVRRKCGLNRDPQKAKVLKTRRVAVTVEVKDHFRRANLHLSVAGLWRWRTAALAMHRAGIPMQSGTVSVERLWSGTEYMFPDAGRCIREEWFEFLADVSYMRYNYRHFNHSTLPTWCRNDSLLAERVDLLVSIAKSLQEAGADSGPDMFPMQLGGGFL